MQFNFNLFLMAELYVVTVPHLISEPSIDNFLKEDPILKILIPEYDLHKVGTITTYSEGEPQVGDSYGILDIFCKDTTKSQLGGHLEEQLGMKFTTESKPSIYYVDGESPNGEYTTGWVTFFTAVGFKPYPIPHVIIQDIVAKEMFKFTPNSFRFFMDLTSAINRYPP